MDREWTRCAQCGAPASSGRFCTNCGAPLGAALGAPPVPPPPEPAHDDTPTRERVHAVPDDPPPAAPLHAAPLHAAPPYAEPVPGPEPVHAEHLTVLPPYDQPIYAQPVHAATPTRRAPGAGLWIGSAAGLVLVLLLGAFLLLNGGGDESPAASATPLVPKAKPTHTSAPKSSGKTSAPTTAPATAPTGARADVAGLSQASAPSHAPAGVDFSGSPVTFVAPNMVDGVVETCWRTAGDATGMVLTFQLDQPTQLTKVGLINGYAKTAFSGGRRYDWYQGDRRVLSVDWVFDDGSTVSQQLSETRAMQTRIIPPVTTATVQLRITAVTPPGRGPASRNDTAVSEVSLVGAPS